MPGLLSIRLNFSKIEEGSVIRDKYPRSPNIG